MVSVGDKAVYIAKVLWPEIQLVKNGNTLDKHGIDALRGTTRIQIKGDESIAVRSRIYHEIYEKTKGKPWQNWRHSPGLADEYIFVTNGYAARISVHELAIREKNKPLTPISDTSMGFCIPNREFTQVEWKEHDLWGIKEVPGKNPAPERLFS